MRELKSPFAGELSHADACDLADVFKVLNNPSRLMMISLLASGKARIANQMMAPLGVHQGTVAHHVAELTEAGLVQRGQMDGQCQPLSVDMGAFAELARLLRPKGGR